MIITGPTQKGEKHARVSVIIMQAKVRFKQDIILFLLFLNKNVCCRYSKKNLSMRLDETVVLSSQNILKLMVKKIFTLLCSKMC